MKKSQASLRIDLLGPSTAVDTAVATVTHALAQFPTVMVSYPEPLRITPIVRERRTKAKIAAEAAQPELLP